ncbi:MAG: Rid family hydrolase [Gemmatimonadota bacterium]
MIVKSVVSSRAPEAVGPFPHAKQVGHLLFVSGIGPRMRGSNIIPGVTLDEAGTILSYDFETQCRAVFENIRMVVEDAGSHWGNIVDVTSFLTDMKADFLLYNRLFGEYFKDNQPARTTIEVSRLPTPIAIELKVIAVMPA